MVKDTARKEDTALGVFQLGASLLDAVVLSVISAAGEEGTYGYKITQDIRRVMELSESTLYPVLRRLLKDQLLSTYDRAFDGRNRRYYRITPAGRVRLAQYLIEWKDYRTRIERVFFGGEGHG